MILQESERNFFFFSFIVFFFKKNSFTPLTAEAIVGVPQLNTTTTRTVSLAQHPHISEAIHPKQYDSPLFVGGSMQFISTDEHAAEVLFASDDRRKPGQRAVRR